MSGRRFADRVTDDERARIVAAYRDTRSAAVVADRFGRSARVVRAVLRDGGITLRSRGGGA